MTKEEILTLSDGSRRDGRGILEIALRDAYAAGCNAARERSIYVAMDYAKDNAPKIAAELARATCSAGESP